MTWERRIRKLELHFYGDDGKNGVTWEEFQHIYLALDPEKFKEQAKTNRDMQRIMSTPPPRNLDRLMQRFYWAAKEDREAQLSGHSPLPSETYRTSPCSSPVLTGTTFDESAPASPSNNREPVGVARKAGSERGQARAQALKHERRPKTARKPASARVGRKP